MGLAGAMNMQDDEKFYARMDAHWVPRACPRCGKPAHSHGWLFKEPTPSLPFDDKRKPIMEIFMHDGADDCRVRSRSAS